MLDITFPAEHAVRLTLTISGVALHTMEDSLDTRLHEELPVIIKMRADSL